MAILDFDEKKVEEIIQKHLSPSAEIRDPERLIGRDKFLKKIRRALNSPKRHVFIHGERGVGKTSLAITAGQLLAPHDDNFVYVDCGQNTTFGEVIQRIGNSVIDVSKRLSSSGPTIGGGVGVAGLGNLNLNFKGGEVTNIPAPTSTAEAYDILQFVRQKRTGQIIIVIDEFDRIQHTEKTAFAELLKNVGTQIDDLRLIFCGIGMNVEEVLGEHGSTGRTFETVEMDKLSHDKLWQIINSATEPLGISIGSGILKRIGIISDGFPHFVHLIGECLIYAMLDDEKTVSICERRHFEIALTEALQKTEPYLRSKYSMATEKTKLQNEYEEALWALADRTETRRKLDDIEASYRRITAQRHFRKDEKPKVMTRTNLNQRLLRLRENNHSNLVVGHGSGRFSFREGVMRGYVRLRAENEGIELSPEQIT
ncbi:ATP-binding protein [Roseovarius sp. EL26]|uniref:ATP-binding protein n=1 Tax=Roseovarius sp. EL26 TaxID=2126672 RepID=UPI000EA04BBF|nr:ATP-binding protein [Roseovarius sp. EL26]